MPSVIQLLRSQTAGHVPSSLLAGQVAINEADSKLFFRDGSGVVTPFLLPGAGGRNLIRDAHFARPLGGRDPLTAAASDVSWPWHWDGEYYISNSTNQNLSATLIEGPFKGTKALRFTWAVAPTSGVCQLRGPGFPQQGVALLAGRVATMSHYFRSSNDVFLEAFWDQYFGSGGSSALNTFFAQGNHTGSANWVRHSSTNLIPSIESKTIGTDPEGRVFFEFAPRHAANYDLACPQLQEGGLSDFVVDPLRTNGGNSVGFYHIKDQVSPTFDAMSGRTTYARLEATAARTMAAPTGRPDQGQRVVIEHYASGGSARTLSLATASAGQFAFGSTITGLTSTVSAKSDFITVIWSSWHQRWLVAEYVKGYSAA